MPESSAPSSFGTSTSTRIVRLIRGLARDDTLAQQFAIAAVRRGLQLVVGARVRDLLIDLGRFELGERLAGADPVTLVDVNLPEITRDLRVHRGFRPCANRRRHLERARRRQLARTRHEDAPALGELLL